MTEYHSFENVIEEDDGVSIQQNDKRPCISMKNIRIFKTLQYLKKFLTFVLTNVFASIVIIILAVALSVGVGLYALLGAKPHPVVDVSIRAFNIPNHIASRRQEAFEVAKSTPANSYRKRRTTNDDSVDTEESKFMHTNDLRPRRSLESQDCGTFQYMPQQRVQLIYIAKEGDNIFTRDRIEIIHKIEKEIMSMDEFSNFCYVDGMSSTCDCLPINSLLTYFYPTFKGWYRFDGKGSDLMNIDEMLLFAMANSRNVYWYTDGRLNATFHESRFLRSEIIFGGPLKGFKSRNDRRAEQEDLFKKFISDLCDRYLSKLSTNKVRVLYAGNELFDYQVNQTFWNDMKLAIISFVLIVIFVFVLTSFSVWLTFWGIVSILLSFPLAFFFYRVVFDINAVGILNGAAAFVVVGIGVDDVFVFINTFRQADHIPDLSTRMFHTMKTAGKATFFTSFTTAAAFAANIASSIPAVYEFGLFMTLIVSSCWVSVILVMPSAINIWYRWFSCCESKCFFCCVCCHKVESSLKLPEDIENFLGTNRKQTNPSSNDEAHCDDDVQMLNIEEPTIEESLGIATDEGIDISDDGMDDPLLRLDESRPKVATGKPEGWNMNLQIQGFIYYFLALPVLRARWIIAGLYVLVLVASIASMSQLHAATKPPALFRSDTNLQQVLDLVANYSSPNLKCDDCSGYYKSAYRPMPASPTSRSINSERSSTRTSSRVSTTTSTTSTQTNKPTTTTTTTTTTPAMTVNRSIDSNIQSSVRMPLSTTTTSAFISFLASSASSIGTPEPVSTTVKDFNSPSSTTRVTSVSSVTAGFHPCSGNQCDDIQSHPKLEVGVTVYIVFGIKDIDRRNITFDHVISEKGSVVYDDELSSKLNVNHMNPEIIDDFCRLCVSVSNNSQLVAVTSEFLSSSEMCKSAIYQYIQGYSSLPTGLLVGVNNSSIKWIAYPFQSTTYKGQSSFTAYQQYQQWETFVDELRATLPSGSPLRSVFQTSEFWKQVMMEVVAVSSAIYGLLLSLVICVGAVAVFTGHLALLVIITTTMIGMICFVLAVFFWAGWEFGAIEAISLSILVGSSVDYCVHIVEGYLLAGENPPEELAGDNKRLRRWRASAAVSHIGASVVSSAVTTIIAAIPLSQTILLPFARFGSILAINTSVSIVYSLTVCVSFLGIFAPAKFVNRFRSAVIAFILVVLSIGSVILLLFILSKNGVHIPAPNGGDLFPVQ